MALAFDVQASCPTTDGETLACGSERVAANGIRRGLDAGR